MAAVPVTGLLLAIETGLFAEADASLLAESRETSCSRFNSHLRLILSVLGDRSEEARLRNPDEEEERKGESERPLSIRFWKIRDGVEGRWRELSVLEDAPNVRGEG